MSTSYFFFLHRYRDHRDLHSFPTRRSSDLSLAYAQERRQGLAIGASGKDSPIIDHPDVRRMLMTQKAYLAALRHLMLLNAINVDHSTNAADEAERTRADEIVGLLTPVCKGFGTDLGNELTSIALQIHGGSGYVEETGVSQYYRDVRIAAIYEGTNGIQAADLVGRKLGVRMGASFTEFISSMKEIDGQLADAGDEFASIRSQLATNLGALEKATGWMLRTGMQDPNAGLSGSWPYLRMWGLCLGGWLLAKAALGGASSDEAVAEEKLVTARFYAEQLLPQAGALLGAVTAGADDLFALDAAALG